MEKCSISTECDREAAYLLRIKEAEFHLCTGCQAAIVWTWMVVVAVQASSPIDVRRLA